MLPAIVPSAQNRRRCAAVIGWPPNIAAEPTGSPAAAVASVMAITRDGRFAATAMRTIAGWT